MSNLRDIVHRLLPVALAFTVVPVVSAQGEYHFITAGIGGGFTTQSGRTGNYLDNGGNFQATAGVNVGPLSLNGTFMFNGMGLTGRALSDVNVPDGYAHVYTLTVDPKLRVPLGIASVYVLAGGGWMRRTVVYTQPVLVPTFIFDPWWGYYGPALVQADQKLGSVSNNAGVWDVGAGFDVPLPRTRWKLFVEARYFDGLTNQTHTSLVPITIGLRW